MLAPAGLLAALLGARSPAAPTLTITVQNRLPPDRPAETISIPVANFRTLLQQFGPANLLVQDAQTGRVLVSQPIDNDGDGTVDALLFQASLKAGGRRAFTLTGAKDGAARQPKSQYTTYSRFVPERTDDYAWENDRVAFRTYGPEAERLVVAHEPGGTLTSGMDEWLKRVPYPVIDKWYAANVKEVLLSQRPRRGLRPLPRGRQPGLRRRGCMG